MRRLPQLVSPVGDLNTALPGMQTLATIEGNRREINLLGRDMGLPPSAHTGQTRFEQVDGDLTGATHAGQALTAISWRRDGSVVMPDDLQATNRVVRLHLRVGLGTYDDFGSTFGANFENSSSVAGPTTVLGSPAVFQAFNFPDFRNAPPTAPASFVVPLPFNQVYVIPGNSSGNFDSFIWSLAVEGATSGCYPLDAVKADSAMTLASSLGVGCIVGSNVAPMSLRVDGVMEPTAPSYSLIFDVDHGPVGEMVLINVGLNPINLPIPGLCTNLYVQRLADLTIPMVTNAVGSVSHTFTGPWDDSFRNVHLHFQGWSPDMGQRFPIQLAGTNGVDHRIVEATPRVKSIMAFTKNAAQGLGGVKHGAGVVTLLDQ